MKSRVTVSVASSKLIFAKINDGSSGPSVLATQMLKDSVSFSVVPPACYVVPVVPVAPVAPVAPLSVLSVLLVYFSNP